VCQTDGRLCADFREVSAMANNFRVRYLLRVMPGWHDHLPCLGPPGLIREKDDSSVFLQHASSVGL